MSLQPYVSQRRIEVLMVRCSKIASCLIPFVLAPAACSDGSTSQRSGLGGPDASTNVDGGGSGQGQAGAGNRNAGGSSGAANGGTSSMGGSGANGGTGNTGGLPGTGGSGASGGSSSTGGVSGSGGSGATASGGSSGSGGTAGTSSDGGGGTSGSGGFTDGGTDAGASDSGGPVCDWETCANGVDDNGNQDVDCDDADCDGAPACRSADLCGNGIDDDGDLSVDCDDDDCADGPACQTGWDPRFSAGSNTTVNDIVVSGSDVYFAGELGPLVMDIGSSGIVRFDGARWHGLGSGLNATTADSEIRSIDIHEGSGRIYAAGSISAGGDADENAVVWDPGTETWSPLGPGLSQGWINVVHVDGTDVYIGGSTAGSGFVRIYNETDDSWSDVGTFPLGEVNALLRVDGELFAAGRTDSSTYGTYGPAIAKWTGSEWVMFPTPDTTFVQEVHDLAYDGSDLYLTGEVYFTDSSDTKTSGGVARLDPATGVFSPLGDGLGLEKSHGLGYDLVWDGSDLLVGGWFDQAGGHPIVNIARWDGCRWAPASTGLVRPPPASRAGPTPLEVRALARDPSGKLWAGGYFEMGPGQNPPENMAVNAGNGWQRLTRGSRGNQGASVFESDADGRIYAGDFAGSLGNITAVGLARFNGVGWESVGEILNDVGLYSIPPGRVTGLARDGDTLFVGGEFTSTGGVSADNIAAYDIASDQWSALGSGLTSNWVNSLLVSDGNLYAGGTITSAGGTSVNNIARWDISGAQWHALGSGVSGGAGVLALADFEGDIYAGGGLDTAGDTSVNHIAKWNGTGWSPVGEAPDDGTNGPVSALAVIGTDLYAGGHFTTAGGEAATCVARWNGSAWSAVGSGITAGCSTGTTGVDALAVDGTDLYVAGDFTEAGGKSATRVAVVDTTTNTWSALGSGIGGDSPATVGDPFVQALHVSDGLYVGGSFTEAGGEPSRNIARWVSP